MKKQFYFQNDEPWIKLSSKPQFSYLKMGVINRRLHKDLIKLNANIKNAGETIYYNKRYNTDESILDTQKNKYKINKNSNYWVHFIHCNKPFINH